MSKRSILWALLLGLAVGAGYATADTSVDKKKANPGQACKTNSDCDQSRPASCINNKCQLDPMPPPPT
ncbi:MAG TPA: hypothetical protein VFF06_03270 [Polyangia bacterium]|nr:hypothetical protein [Polyangia bacterium]